MKGIRISVDDNRPLPIGYDLLFTSAEQFIAWRQQHSIVPIINLTLDHDLGVNHLSGYELVKQLVSEGCQHIESIQFHTNNLVGFDNMLHYLQNAQRCHVINSTLRIDSHHYQQLNNRLLQLN